MSTQISPLSDNMLPTSRQEVNDMDRVELVKSFERTGVIGVRLAFIRGLILWRIREDYETAPEKFQDLYEYPDYDEWVRAKARDKEYANRLIADYRFIEYYIDQGMDPSLFFDAEDNDIIRTARGFVAKTGIAYDLNAVEQVMKTAKALQYNRTQFREWARQEALSSGKDDPDKIEIPPMSRSQREAWAFREGLKELRALHAAAEGERKQGLKEAIDLLDNLFQVESLQV